MASGATKLRELLPNAIDTGGGEFEVPIKSVDELNEILSKLISAHVLIASVVPSRSVLEQQFREAVGEES